MSRDDLDLHGLAADTVRFLAADMVQRASSGHPGLPMGAADYAVTLWTDFVRQDPACPTWPDRDRFVLSAGHGCALLYALLHLSGYGLSLAELKSFRQWGCRTPGHSERAPELAIETTTGPLGQGFATAVGMAMAERALAARFNRPGLELVDHRTWVLAGDGDLMEGVSAEAASLAGHLRLGRLIVLYDANRITIEGSTDLAFTEDVAARFRAYGWGTWEVDGYDQAAVAAALSAARDDLARPSLLVCRSQIGRRAPKKAGTAEAHGAPLGVEELAGAKRGAGWPESESFRVPPPVPAYFARRLAGRAGERAAWDKRLARLRAADPALAAEWDRCQAGRLPEGFELPFSAPAAGSQSATRSTSGTVIQLAAARLPELLGGSADLAPSNDTLIKGEADFAPPDYAGRNLRFGVREHAMAAVMNGILCHGGLRVFGGTFLVFSDYMRPAIRLAAMMKLPAIYVFTHDSFYLGEDGPTHQPVSHLIALRSIPNLAVLRPADAAETVAAWRIALEHRGGPTALILTRQKVPALAGTVEEAHRGILAGGRILRDPERPALVLVATGSEVATALAAAERLAAGGIEARVVSVAWLEALLDAPCAERDRLLPPGLPALPVEAASRRSWEWLAGCRGPAVTLDRFGASAPAEVLAREFGFSPEAVAERARALLSSRS